MNTEKLLQGTCNVQWSPELLFDIVNKALVESFSNYSYCKEMIKQVLLTLTALHEVKYITLAHGTNTLNMKSGLWPLMKEPISVLS